VQGRGTVAGDAKRAGDEWRAVGAGWPPLSELGRARRRMRATSPSDRSAVRDDQWGTAQAAAHQ